MNVMPSVALYAEIVLLGLAFSGYSESKSQGAMLQLHLRKVVESPAGSALWKNIEIPAQWPLLKTAIIISDMWDAHHCKTAEKRVAELAPRINTLIKNLRSRGAHIIHCPSDTMDFYAHYPQRIKVQKASQPDKEVQKVALAAKKRRMHLQLPIDDSDGGCDQSVCVKGKCRPQAVWNRQIETIEIHEKDAIADDFDIHYYMQQKGIEYIILLGVHENECILTRPFGIIALTSLGYTIALVRDLTDTMYNPLRKPYVNHFIGNDLMTWYIEKCWCPTITSAQILGGKPFSFAADLLPPRKFKEYAHLLSSCS